MSELINTHDNRTTIRWKLLTGASAIALMAYASGVTAAGAEDADQPNIWLELGGQFEHTGTRPQTYAPDFLASFDHLDLAPVLPVQNTTANVLGEEGKISFGPEGSSWVFSAAIRYGRSEGHKNQYQQLPPVPFQTKPIGATQAHIVYQGIPYHLNATAQNSERHMILDFQAGKDVGLGISSRGTSVLGFGVRYAQFTMHRSAGINGVPDFFQTGTSVKYGVFASHHRYYGSMEARHSFRGIGPSVSWNASAPIAGQTDDGELTIDWGINAAVLFGKQKVRGQTHRTSEHYKTYEIFPKYGTAIYYSGLASSHRTPGDLNRSRSVTVPNVGGFAGMSWRYADAKVSIGYRADMFFGAMDNGIDTRHSANRRFYGPFATISIGLSSSGF